MTLKSYLSTWAVLNRAQSAAGAAAPLHVCNVKSALFNLSGRVEQC